ncbi:mechanosensitive ion channel [Sphingomonas sinipercae]|uniref:Mechanosensitive ion channel n=1 Tax=Sphingomonas sinipercae TaxID=2714944 RepID=A0A6G7ZP99_9SPHN|nr:mechanosensitive ion channel domain-containing protein [Sphingomonas sinipercae]QIL02730.1 mechanosensitive ion channel [Sphingomonas sinipercae]
MNERITWPGRTAAWLSQNSTELLIGLAVALALVALMLMLRSVGHRIIANDPHCRTWRSVIGRVLAKTSLLFMVVTALDIVASYTAPPSRVGRLVDIAFIIVAALQTAAWVRELIMGIIGRQIGDDPGESTLGNARTVVRVLVSVALFAVAGIVILDNLGVNVTALVAGLGIGGIAIGLAAQGIFADLFAALAILFDRPFRRGDTISYGGSTGTVERIGLKTTRMRALSGEQLVMSNTKLLDQEIRNLAEGLSRRNTLNFGVVYQTGADQLRRLREIAESCVAAEPGCTFVRCVMTGFGPSSLDHELVYDVASLDPNIIGAHRTAIMMAIIEAFAGDRIEFAYPTQTTFTAAPDGTLVMPYATPPAQS